MKILVTGASGLLGSRLYEILSKNHEVAGTYMSKKADMLYPLDITNFRAVEDMLKTTRPDFVVHTASFVNVDKAEIQKDIAREINQNGTLNIAKACAKNSSRLVYISSDFVFEGNPNILYNEESPTNALNFYGQTKLAGEEIVRETIEKPLIIRPALLYGNDTNTKSSFITSVVEKLRKGEKFLADNSIIKYPTLTDDVSYAIKALIEKGESGIYHISGKEGLTKFEWAKKIARAYRLDDKLIVPIEESAIAKRPKNARLDSSKLESRIEGFNTQSVDSGIRIVKNQKGCLFKMIYSLRPDMLMLDRNASQFRIDLGKQLAREAPSDADIVVPIPETGMYGATGYSAQAGIPFVLGIIRDYFTNKTLFEPTLDMRTAALEKKLIIVPQVVKDKKVALIDEAIIAGTTLKVVVDKLKNAGVSKIDVRIPSPAMLSNCNNNILKKDAYLLAREFGDNIHDIEKGLEKYFDVDSLKFLSLDGFLRCLPDRSLACFECFKSSIPAKLTRYEDIPVEIREKGGYSIKRLLTEPLRTKPDNVGFYETTIPAHSKVTNHYHERLDEFLYFLTPGIVTTKDKRFDLKPGDILTLAPGEAHEIVAEDNEVKLIAVKIPNIPEDKVNP
jgi:dTDP-4-dehydrorhamnose reductase